jgi:hypothetical protein
MTIKTKLWTRLRYGAVLFIEGAGGADGGGGGGAGAGAGAGGGGGAAIDYGALYKTLSPENQEVFTRKGYDKGGKDGQPIDVNGLLDNIRHQDTLIGKNNLAPPDMTSDDPFKTWEGGRKALGILDKPEDYKLARKDMPKGADGKPLPYDEEGEKVFRQAIAGVVPQKYAQKVFDALQDMQIARMGSFQQQLAEEKTATDEFVKKEWGAGASTKLARAQVIADSIAEKLGVDPAKLKTDANTAMGSVGVLKLFDFLAEQFGEGFIKDGGQGGDSGNENTPVGAKAAIARLDMDVEFSKARSDASHAGHKAAVKRYADLHKVAHGN